MIAKWGSDCPACHQPIDRGTDIKRWVRRIGGFGPEGHWEDTGQFKHATCPKTQLPSRRASRISRAQVLIDYDGLSDLP